MTNGATVRLELRYLSEGDKRDSKHGLQTMTLLRSQRPGLGPGGIACWCSFVGTRSPNDRHSRSSWNAFRGGWDGHVFPGVVKYTKNPHHSFPMQDSFEHGKERLQVLCRTLVVVLQALPLPLKQIIVGRRDLIVR